MAGRIHRRNPMIEGMLKLRHSKSIKYLRAMVKKSVKWANARQEKRQISLLSARLQLHPEKLVQLFEGKKHAGEVIQELEHMVQMADQAGLDMNARKELFKKARNVNEAKAYLEQQAG